MREWRLSILFLTRKGQRAALKKNFPGTFFFFVHVLFHGLPSISVDPKKLCGDSFTRSTNSAIPHLRDHHFEIEGRWRAHGNEESSEEACKEEEVVPVPWGGAGHGASSPSKVLEFPPPHNASQESRFDRAVPRNVSGWLKHPRTPTPPTRAPLHWPALHRNRIGDDVLTQPVTPAKRTSWHEALRQERTERPAGRDHDNEAAALKKNGEVMATSPPLVP